MSIWDNLISQHGQNATKTGGGDVWGDLIATHGGATPKQAPVPLDGSQAPGHPATTQWRGAKFEETKPQTPEEKQLAAELRHKADDILFQGSPEAKNPAYTALSTFSNTALANIPRNISAGLQTAAYGDTFKHNYDHLKAVEEASARRNPKAAMTGGVAGALDQAAMIPIAAAPTWGMRALQSAGTGGLLAGTAEAIDSKDARKTVESTVIGAGLGAIASPATEAASKVVSSVARPFINVGRGLINPEKEAARRVGEAVQADISRGKGGLTADQMDAAAFNGQPTVIADMGGERTKSLARSAANTSPEARDALNKVVNDRFEGQSGRVHDMLSDISETGGTAAPDLQEALKTKARQLNKPAYKAAYDKGANGVWSDELSSLAAAPDVAEAIAGATRTGRNKSVVDGFAPVKNPFNIAEDGSISLKRNADGSEAIPSLQFWDHVKQNLDDKVTKLRRNGDFQAAADTTALKNKLLEHLDAAVPEYSTARKGAAQFFGANDALEAGQKFVSAGGENAAFSKQIGKMNDAEKKLFGEGFLSALRDKVSNVRDRASVLNQIFQSPKARERVNMALGAGKAKEIEAMLHIERIMDELRGTVQGNSTTARQLAELSMAGGIGGAIGLASGEDMKTSALAGAAVKFAHGKIDERVARKVGELLASGDKASIDKVMSMAKNSESIMNFMRSFNVAKAASTAASHVGDVKRENEGRK